jgi:membrane protein
MKPLLTVLTDAINHYNNDDGWAMASHVALSGILALFPFLIFATALASFLGADRFAETAVHVVFDTWPETIAKPIADEVMNVLTVQRSGLLTVSVLAAAFFASNGIEALRVSLNRAYRVSETRNYLFCRLQSLGLVVVATLGILAISLLLVLAPVAQEIAQRYFPFVKDFATTIDLWRYAIASIVLVFGLVAVHYFLPAGQRSLLDTLPGIAVTLVAWIGGSYVFALYLASFANYVSTYAGLASLMIALVFLYIIAAIFIFGGEINAAIMRYRVVHGRRNQKRKPAEPPAS